MNQESRERPDSERWTRGKIKGEGRSPQEGAETTCYAGVGIPDAATFTRHSVKHEIAPVSRPAFRRADGAGELGIYVAKRHGGAGQQPTSLIKPFSADRESRGKYGVFHPSAGNIFLKTPFDWFPNILVS